MDIIILHCKRHMDECIHELQVHTARLAHMELPDGSFLVAGIASQVTTRQALEAVDGVTVFPHRHSSRQLGEKAKALSSMKKAPDSTHTVGDLLRMIDGVDLFHPDN